jgi:hypothetical protein
MNHIHLTDKQARDLCYDSCIDYEYTIQDFIAVLNKYNNEVPIMDKKYHNLHYIEGETYIIECGDYDIYYPWELNIIYARKKHDKE